MRIFKFCTILFSLLYFSTIVQASSVKVVILDLITDVNKVQATIIKNDLQKALTDQKLIVTDVSNKSIINSLKKMYKKNKNTEDMNTILKGNSVQSDFVIWGEIKSTTKYIVVLKVYDVTHKKNIYSKEIELSSLDDIANYIPVMSASIAERIQYKKARKYPHNVNVSAVYFTANNSFDGMIKDGYGAGLNYYYQFLDSNIIGGADVRFYSVDGDHEITDSAVLIPLCLYVGYDFQLKYFSIIPLLYAGSMYNAVQYYTNFEKSSFYKKRFWRSLNKVGMRVNIPVSDPVTMMGEYDFGILYDNGDLRTYHSVSFGLQLSFWL